MRAMAIRRLVCALIGHTPVCEPYKKISHHEDGMRSESIGYARRCIVCGEALE